MIKHSDVCTHIKNPKDRDILRRKLFDVNLRLMGTSVEYQAIVMACASYIRWCSVVEKEGYPKPKGFSGANAGIPFNIIVVGGETMINPKILERSVKKVRTQSNCGSLTLPEPIAIVRHAWIRFEFYDSNGIWHSRRGFYPTVQHEVDHNNGMLITDRTP